MDNTVSQLRMRHTLSLESEDVLRSGGRGKVQVQRAKERRKEVFLQIAGRHKNNAASFAEVAGSIAVLMCPEPPL